MDNCPHQVVVCGTDEEIARAQTDLRKKGAVCQRLPFSRAYHTPLFAPVCEELRAYYERAAFAAPRIPLYSCATAAPVPADPDEVRRLALEQWARPVRFRETIEAMYGAGFRIFVEVGPRGNLTAFVEDTLRGRPHLAVPSNLQRRPGMTQLHHLLALLAAHGVPLTLEPLYSDRGARRLPLEAVLAGARLQARPDRSMALSLELPRLRVEDRLVARAAAPPATALALAPPGPAAAAPPAQRPAGSAAMHEYLRTMETFLKTQQEVMQAALSGGGRPWRLPILDAPARRQTDGSLAFRKDLSADEEPFVLDHTLGGSVSDDPTLRALPVFPLTMSLEIMAEAATLALPGRLPVGMRSVRAHRWLAFAAPRLTVEIAAAPRPGGNEVDVRISELREGGAALLTVEGTVVLGDRFPAAPRAPALEIGATRPFRWKPDELYAEGRLHGMFHGPSFRGVVSIDRAGEDGAEGTLRVLPRHGLFRSRPDPAFVLDPLLLDAASQVVGYWTANALERGFVVFPVGFERLDLYAPPLPPGAHAGCRVRGRSVGDDQIFADIEIVSGDGRTLARVTGWEVRRIDLPERFYAYRLAPRDVILSTPLPAPAPARDSVLCRLDLPERLLEADGRIWREGLAHTVLSRGEREAWRALPGAETRRTEWLLARLAAKDAVRLFLKERCGIRVCAADVEIGSDAHGRPVASGAWIGRAGGAPVLSMACGGSVAGARAGDLMARAGGDGDLIVATALCEGGA
ncbi:MAG: hypothetical protein AUH92_01435 [Acidobacteria bacterium 13_1_40CM_4_69_4]|nr:MAG: hypothetical protein AUH92_01435 [Acidobacteria bacterium 13_1_40CM_4_69_4]